MYEIKEKTKKSERTGIQVIVRECQPVLAELTARTGETTDLSVMRSQACFSRVGTSGGHR